MNSLLIQATLSLNWENGSGGSFRRPVPVDTEVPDSCDSISSAIRHVLNEDVERERRYGNDIMISSVSGYHDVCQDLTGTKYVMVRGEFNLTPKRVDIPLVVLPR